MRNPRSITAVVGAAALMLLAATPIAGQDFGRDDPSPEQQAPTDGGIIGPESTPVPVPQEEAPSQPSSYTVPAFTIEAISFTAIDETGIDLLGSDSIFLTWDEDPEGLTTPHATSDLFKDVDSGDTRYFHEQQRCMYPMGATPGFHLRGWKGVGWLCHPEGGTGDVSIRVDIFESNDSWVAGCGAFTIPGCSESWIGGHWIIYNEAELLQQLTSPGDVFEITVRLDKKCRDDQGEMEDEGSEPGANLCSAGVFEADYDFTYRVSRLADQVRYHHDHLE